MSERAIAVLKKTIENHKSHALLIGNEIQEKREQLSQLQSELKHHATQVTELEEAIKTLEKKEDVQATSKSKKAKR